MTRAGHDASKEGATRDGGKKNRGEGKRREKITISLKKPTKWKGAVPREAKTWGMKGRKRTAERRRERIGWVSQGRECSLSQKIGETIQRGEGEMIDCGKSGEEKKKSLCTRGDREPKQRKKT